MKSVQISPGFEVSTHERGKATYYQIKANDLFKQGFADFKNFLPRPPVSKDGNSSEDARYYGWMIARTEQIKFIWRRLKLSGLQEGTPQYELRSGEAIDSMDKEHGLYPRRMRR